jgi:hypothetical protein
VRIKGPGRYFFPTFLSEQGSFVRHGLVNLILPQNQKQMKSFMFLFRGGSEAMNMSPEESQQHMQKWFTWVEQLKADGIYAGGEALMPTGKTLRSGSVITDGPYAESKELVGGFFVVKAESIEAASELAKSCPDLPLGGTVEVRDVVVFG